jgi:hypothetical protein
LLCQRNNTGFRCFQSVQETKKVVNQTLSEMQIMAMKPTRIVRRRREVQAYYGSARSDGSRLPFLLEHPVTANAFCLYGFIAHTCRCAAENIRESSDMVKAKLLCPDFSGVPFLAVLL